MRIGYLGPAGTYTQQAMECFIERLKLSSVEQLPLGSIEAVLESLSQSAIDSAVLPLRNSLAGDYCETVAGLQRYDFNCRASLDLPIRLAFGIHPESDEDNVCEVRSKDTALRECSRYLAQHHPRARLICVESTTIAMQEIMQKNQRHSAAIGSQRGMDLYGLRIVNDNIVDQFNLSVFYWSTI